MEKPLVKVRIADHARGLPLPAYMSEGSAGADVRAAIEGELTVMPGETTLVPTGLHFELPPGYELQVRPRSGLALNHGITLPNSPGTLDADFRGELKVILMNLGKKPFLIKRGDRIAQAVITRFAQATFAEDHELSQTKRGSGGLGSTGRD
ncbi:dUTP diphosphatase [Candidatus Micrarchaeota archaeon]|nr:dUTP diphosphatase [Candidatus Micrarchaeota archaeon]